MKKLVLTVSVLLLSLTGISQNVSYKKIYDDPNKIAPLNISVLPLYLDLYGASSTFANSGVGIGARFMLKNIATIEASSRVSIIGAGDNSRFNYSTSEIMATYHFKDKTFGANLPVTLSSSSNTYTTTTKYINVPANKRSITGLRLGFVKGFTYVDKDFQNLKSPFVEKNSSGDTPDYLNGTDAHLPPFSVVGMNTSNLCLGISKHSITNLKINVDGYSIARKHKRENEMYFDLLFNLNTKLENQTSEDGTVWEMSNDKISRLGFKTGYIMKRGFFTYKVEMASRPGVKGGNFSFFQGLIFNIPLSLGQKPEILN